jgi:hypothetical protein
MTNASGRSRARARIARLCITTLAGLLAVAHVTPANAEGHGRRHGGGSAAAPIFGPAHSEKSDTPAPATDSGTPNAAGNSGMPTAPSPEAPSPAAPTPAPPAIPHHASAAGAAATAGVQPPQTPEPHTAAALEPEPAGAVAPELTEPPPGPGPVVLDGGLRVEVTGDQRATIIGDTPSLRAVVEETCRQAGIQLRTYAAADRRYVGRLEHVAVADALRSMLRSESYLLGVRADGSGREHVTWLRVLGAEGSATKGQAPSGAAIYGQPQPAAAASAPQSDKFVVSSSLMFQAFGTFDPQRREQAQRELLTRIGDPEQLSKFLASDPKELAKQFGRYRGAADTLRRIHDMADRVEIQAKFQEILGEIEKDATQP